MQDRSGKESEDIIELICTSMFFSDFVVRNPEFTKPGGKRIELADLLVPFGNTLLVFQVKSRSQTTTPSEKSDVEFQRLTNAIDEAVGQVKTIKRALSHDWLRGLETARGYSIDVDPSDISNVIGIVVLDLIGEETLPIEDRSQLFGSYIFMNGLPIHVLLASEFFELSHELDTLPDFLRFLEVNRGLYEKDLILIPPSTLDLLALYKMQPDMIEDAISRNTHLLIEEGMWDAYHANHSREISTRDRLNQPSYLIDIMIKEMHTGVGYEIPPNYHQPNPLIGYGTAQSYLDVTRELSSLSRLDRRILGERLQRCLDRSMKVGEAFSAMIDSNQNAGYLVYCISGNRAERQSRLELLTSMLYCRHKLDKVIGIATEPLVGEGRSYDVIGYSGVTFKNSEQLAEQAKQFFGELRTATGSEYTEGDQPNA
jgi:hypothetical protein